MEQECSSQERIDTDTTIEESSEPHAMKRSLSPSSPLSILTPTPTPIDRSHASEHPFKLRLTNLPYFYHAGALKKFLSDKSSSHMVVRKAEKSHEGFIGFRTLEDLESMRAQVHGVLLKGKIIAAEQVESNEDEREERRLEHEKKKQKLQQSQRQQGQKADDDSTPVTNEEELIQDQVTPLWRIDYEKQLVIKSRKARKILDKFYGHLAEACQESHRVPHLNAILDGQARVHLSAMLPSPIVDGYRNKCEFAIGTDSATGQPIIGFSAGSYREGVASPQPCRNVSESMKALLVSLQLFLCASGEPPYDRVTKTGFWRLIVLRENVQHDLMVLFQFHGTTLSPAFVSALQSYCQNEPRIKSAQYQLTESKSFAMDPSIPFTLLYGTPNLSERLCELDFHLSPHAFFQVNRQAAEVLYKLIRELAKPKPKPTVSEPKAKKRILLDLCCGTGSIGLALAAHFDLIVGIDCVASAIEDAMANAQLNHIDHARYICGKLEEKLPSLIQSTLQSEGCDATAEWTVILDPPRAGTHASVIRTIRCQPQISRVIYVSCAPELASKDFLDLCRPLSKKYSGSPFSLDSVTPVDLFPHTEHYELVLVFSRVPES